MLPILNEHFWSKVFPEPNSGCWLWVGATIGDGYGTFLRGSRRGLGPDRRRMELAHRLVYSHWVRPPKQLVLHRCDIRACVNPDHLFEGTHADNAADRDRKGRAACHKGTNNGRAKLTVVQVREIRQLAADGVPKVVLASLFGVTPTQITTIVHRKQWTHI